MIIKSAEFISCCTELSKCPPPGLPEYVFIGRSNVGKSSLINMLTGRNKLAKTSRTPGKTQTIAHFLINNCWHLVDMPGYGYARISKVKRESWRKMIDNFLQKREMLMCVFVLVDSRIPPQANDMEFVAWLGEKRLPLVILHTKADKQSGVKYDSSIAALQKALAEYWDELPPIIKTSSRDETGKDEILNMIERINNEVME
ncbi:MAG: ribosome biogenesis GTP-binding protein YihA/YsxC [Bacteroidetes bacterium]|nr:ribosome biogenesis GTP-binding protein YihA/YsxC [Bacteroidota bacterium]MBU1719985.1 ribosome biogenesis GTP-binding protein YihA/YsxC [Bacteroidota bacterium]MBU1901883.1 ribosome biogenesis GTP-binding protein YihA/YsxC [Patescibacteria group bacterium]